MQLSQRTWRQRAGREGGGEGYQFGDISRSIGKTFADTDWKTLSGRSAGGGDGYQFGDISRSIGKTFADTDWKTLSGRSAGGRGYHFGDITRSLGSLGNSLIASQTRGADRRGVVDIGKIWDAFFKQCTILGKRALMERRIAMEDVVAQEPYLFIGLPSLCLLECVLRSIASDIHPDAVLFADGRQVTSDSIPQEQGAPQLFAALLLAKRRIHDASLNDERRDRLKNLVIRVEGDAAGDVALTQLGSLLQGIATDVSQLAFFRAHFLNVFDELSSSDAD